MHLLLRPHFTREREKWPYNFWLAYRQMAKESSRSKTSCLISREKSIEYVGDVLRENVHHLFFDYSTSIMHVLHKRNVSIIWASFLMKIVGLWLAADQNEQRRRDFALIYTLGALFISICIALRDIYHTWGNFSVSTREFEFDRFHSLSFHAHIVFEINGI